MMMVIRKAVAAAAVAAFGVSVVTAKVQPDGACPLFVLLPFTST